MVESISNDTILEQYSLNRTEQEVSPNQLLQNDFLKLMTEQLKAQDPMSPTDNGEFLSQMAQFSSASSMSQLQSSFDKFAENMMSAQTLNAANLIDREALLPVSVGKLEEDSKVSGAVELPVSSGDVNVTVYDAGGNLIKTIPLGTQGYGMANFTWDGSNNAGDDAPPGNYEFFAELRNEEGNAESALIFMNAKIDSVSLDKGNITLNMVDGSTHSLADVQRIG